MRKYFNKLYLSIALVVLSLLTMVATTYAWVGLLTSTTFDEFTINLQSTETPDAAEYGIELSLEGDRGTFDTSIDPMKLKRKLLENTGIDLTGKTDAYVNEIYRRNKLDQCTVKQYYNNYLSSFTDMSGEVTKNYYWFDLYISIFKIGGASEEESNNKLNLYLRDHILDSVSQQSSTGVYDYTLFNDVEFPTASSTLFGKKILGDSSVPYSIAEGSKISGKVSVDISNACRVALIKHNATEKYEKTGSSVVSDNNPLHIYQNGGLYPTYKNGIYDFGGVLPSEYNFARLYHNSTHPDKPVGEVPNDIINRGDITFNDDGVVNHIIDENDDVTIKKMIKFTIYFWFEGWDSDCFEIIDNKTVNVNLLFSTKSPLED